MFSSIGCAIYAAVVFLSPVTSAGNLTKELELFGVDSEGLNLLVTITTWVHLNFTLYCVHPTVTYSLVIRTDNPAVAKIQGLHTYNISCINATYPPHTVLQKSAILPDSDITSMANAGVNSNQEGRSISFDFSASHPVLTSKHLAQLLPRVEGTFSLPLHASFLGRTRLLVTGRRDVHKSVEMPDFLELPWASSEDIFITEASREGKEVGGDPWTAHGGSDSLASGESSLPAQKRDDTEHMLMQLVVTSTRLTRSTDTVFRAVLSALLIVSTVGIGLQTELGLVKSVLRRPLVPIISFVCQSIIMPVVAFALARTVNLADPAVSLGVFVCGICPTGALSIIFCSLLDSDMPLSVTMTTISSIAASALIPLWLFTVGATFRDDVTWMEAPCDRVVIILIVLLIAPFFLGFVVRNKLPVFSQVILKGVKLSPLVTTVFLATFGIYANLDIFRLFSGRSLLTGCLLPYVGYILGGVVGLVLRQPFYRLWALATETGLQNTAILYVLFVYALPAPECDVMSAASLASAILTPFPVCLVAGLYLLYKKLCSRKKVVDKERIEEVEEPGKNTDVAESEEEENVESHCSSPLNAWRTEDASTKTKSQTAFIQNT